MSKRVRTLWLLLAASFLLIGADSGQVPQDDRCEAICEEQIRACITTCAGHKNPMECDSECREQDDECVHECRS